MALKLARLLVGKRLAACVSIVDGTTSFFRWKGDLKKSRESLVIIKTLKSKFAAVQRFLNANHPYELPEIVSISLGRTSAAYLKWIIQCVR